MLEAFTFFDGTKQELFGEVLIEYSAGHILNTIPKKLSVEHRSSLFMPKKSIHRCQNGAPPC